MKESSIPAGRQKEILDYIERNDCVSIKELSNLFSVSEATIRRDLDDLSDAGFVERTHGGAMRIDRSTAYELNHSKKLELMLNEKKRIGNKAVEYVRDGDTIFLDTGTTTYCIANNLWSLKDLTVITNDLFIASSVALDKSSQLIVTGGIRRYEYGVLIGNMTDDFLRNIKVNVAFLAADAIDIKFGVTNATLQEANTKKIALSNSNYKVLVADHTKIGKMSFAKVADLSEFDVVIMDNGVDEDDAGEISKMTELVIV